MDRESTKVTSTVKKVPTSGSESTCQQIKGNESLTSVHQFLSIKHHLDLFMPMLLDINIKNPGNNELGIIH